VKRVTVSERALVLAPLGRDGIIASAILEEANIEASTCESLPALIRELDAGAAFVVVTEEALSTADLSPLFKWLGDQQEWSDLPFVLITNKGAGGLERNPTARRYLEVLGNVTFLERPFHPTTLVSLAHSALRGRRRQYKARSGIDALRESELRYRTLFENIDEGFCIIEFLDGPHGPLSDYIHVEANPAYTAHTGIPDAIGRKVRDMVPAEADGWVELYRSVLQTGKSIRFERELLATGRHLELAAFRVESSSQRQVAVLFQDITLRKSSELALRASESRLRALNANLEREVAERTRQRGRTWQMSPDLLGIANSAGRLTALNPAWEQALGWSTLDIGERALFDLLHPDDVALTLAAFERLKRGEAVQRVENRLRSMDGSYRWIAWVLVPEGDEFYCSGRDVTEAKRQEQDLAVAQDALRQSQKLEAVGQLTGGVAHDFNNLLTIIKSSTDLLRRPNLADERRRRYIDAIAETVDRAAKLTGQLLAFARRQSLKPEVFSVNERVEALTDMLRPVVGSRVQVGLSLHCSDCYAEADVSQFETALVNMAVNARDAMDGEGMLSVSVKSVDGLPSRHGHPALPGPFIAIVVADTGIGIPPDKLSQIFEPFYTTKEIGKGTGLGLSQVYGFVKQSGGDVTVESEVGRGSTFTVFLPKVEPSIIPVAAKSGGPQPTDGHGKRVLVVEDNVEVGKYSTQILEDLGYVTTWAANAYEALELLKERHQFDLVFSDVVMPGMGGVELGEEIRRHYPDLPVILTSGYSDVLADEGRHGFELLHKPYAVEDLSRLFRRISGVRMKKGTPVA
jgi:PAS domain S-box-containing protein